MNSLLEQGLLSEVRCGNNFSYVLTHNNSFVPTQYKVMLNQTASCLVPCVRMMYNGHTQLYYMVGELKNFASILPTISPDGFRAVVASILSAMIQVRSIGFLDVENIDISFEKIFVDPTTNQVSLIYVPTKNKLHGDAYEAENELRTALIKIIDAITTLATPKNVAMSVDLSNGMLSLDDVLKKITAGGPEEGPGKSRTPELRLRLISDVQTMELLITHGNYIIGKSEDADGKIMFNKYIGRRHCRIDLHGGKFYLVDLESKNHSFVNKKMLPPNKPCQLNNGDLVRLANSDFKVIIR